MSKNKSVSIDPLCGYSPDYLFEQMEGKVRHEMILLKAKVSQYQEKNYPANQRKNISMDETARRNVDALVKYEKYRTWLQRQNPESQNQLQYMQEDISQIELTQEQKIYIEYSVLKYDHKKDYTKKWKVNINPEIDYSYLKDSQVFEILTYMYMFQNGYFPFLADKTQTKAKVYVQLLSKLKKRTSQDIVTFKAPLGKDRWIIFSFMVERLQKQIFTICVEINSIRKDLNLKQIDFQIDKRFSVKKYKIAPGEIEFKVDKNMNLKPEQIFMFDKSFQYSSTSTEKTRKIYPSKVEVTKIALRKDSQVQMKQSFACEIQIRKDTTNYESIRYIYKQLENNDYFSYTLSPAEYDVLQTKGNLIVIGRSGTGKTTCALLRLFFKEINNIEKTQKNVFLTASPVLIAEINKKYDQLKDGIRQLHNIDYFEQNQEIFDERKQIKNFYDRLDQINQASMRQKTGSFLSNKVFPCFLTVNEYIESIDANMQNSFFSGRKALREGGNEEEIIITYPDQIQWEQKIRRTRRIRQNPNQQGGQFNQQESTEIRFEQFAKEIYPLPEIKRLAGRLSPEIIWSQIYSIIKGSSRAHSFVGRCLDFKTYNEESQSKNKFFSKEDRQKIYEIFINYDKIMKETGRHDLLDVVNNVICQMGQRKNNDLALSSLFIDEVQDLPPAFIFLAGKIVQQSLFFCGDTAQTIAKGVNFSFTDIRELFSQKYFEKGFKLQKPEIKRLGANFRSQKQIIHLSNTLIKCLMMMFPQSIDSIPQQISYDQGPKPVIMPSKDSRGLARILRSQFGNLQHNNRNNMFGADKAIIVRKKSAKEKIPKQLSQMTCLTYEQCKGLEYDVVILYDFFTQCPEIQWSYLKHIEVQTSPNGVKTLSFDKNCKGSNMKMYFDLCTELKILYTVITRPRTKLIICDDNIPEHLLRIWKSMDLVQDSLTFYRSQQARLQENMANNNINRPNHNNPLLRENQNINVFEVQNQDQNLDRRNEQNFQRYRKQWAEQGFKFFFDRKFYDQAVNCFRNAELPELQQISKAFFFAHYACNEAETTQQRYQFYAKAGFIFEKHRRKYQAAKCYYLGGQYQRALTLFRELGIKKYQAECHWKLKQYKQADELFYSEQKYEKCFKVLVESQYWFMTLARLYENPSEFRKTRHGLVRRGLYQTMKSYIWAFVTWILDDWNIKYIYLFEIQATKIIRNREENSINSKIKYLKKSYFDYLHQQKLLSHSNQHLKELKNEVHSNFITNLHKNQSIPGVIDMFLTTIIYAIDQLKGYNLIHNFKKYTQQRMTLINIAPDVYYINPSKISNCLQNIFKTLETFGCYLFITKFAKSLNIQEIQELIIIQNILRIDLSKKNKEQTQDDIELHYQLINEVTDAQLRDKLSLLLLFFGRGKGLGHQFQEEDILLSEYMDDFSNSLVEQQCSVVKFKLQKVVYQHEFYCFDKNYKQTHNKRTLHKGYQYKKMFTLIDDMSPNSFLVKNQKQKQYIEHFKKLTKEQAIQLQQKQKLAVEQKLQQLDRKIRRAKADLEFEEKEKTKIFANTFREEAQALEKKNKCMKFIPEYVWLPEECEKKPQKAYTLKKTIDQIKKQRNRILKDIDDKTQKKLQDLRKRIDVLKIIKQLQQTLKLQRQTCTKEYNQCSKKSQQVQYLGHIVREIQKYISPKLEQIKQLQSQKKGSNKQDKKLNSRIKTMTDNMKQEMAVFTQRKKAQEKAKTQFKKLQQKMQGLFTHIQQIEHQIKTNKQYICKLKLGKINQKTNQLKLEYSPEHTVTKIKQQVLRQQPGIKKQGDSQKYVIQNQYRRILDDVKDYLYYHKTVPEGCQQDRTNIVKKIESLNLEIQRLQKQKEDERMKTQARVKVNFQSKCFRKHCWQYRKKFITDEIIYKKTLKQNMDEEFIDVIEIIGRLSPPGTKIPKDDINKNSTLLEMTMQAGDSSFEKIFIMLHFFVHEQELDLLQSLVVKQTYEKFLREMEKFLQNIIKSSVEGLLVKNTLAIFGINVVETFDDDEFKYLEGFSIMQKSHNFFNVLKSQFYHNISSSHVLCRTTDIADIMVNYLIAKVKLSSNIFRIFDLNQFNPLQMQNFQMKSQEFLINYQKKIIGKIRKFEFNKEKNYLTNADIDYMMQDIFDLKMAYFTKMIQLQEDRNLIIQTKASQIIFITEKIIELSDLVRNLDIVIQFNKESLKKVNNEKTFINEEVEEYGKLLKIQMIQKIQQVMKKLQKSKQNNMPIQVENQSKKQEEKNETKTQQSSLSSKKEIPKKQENPSRPTRKNIQQRPRNIRNNNNNNVRNNNTRNRRPIRPIRNFYYVEEQDENEVNQTVYQNYQQRVHYDMITGTWVADN